MGNQYYIRVNGNQEGPFTIEELSLKNITCNSYVWTSGMENWQQADKIEELRVALKLEPKGSVSSEPIMPPPFHPDNPDITLDDSKSKAPIDKPVQNPIFAKPLISYRLKIIFGFSFLFLIGLALVILGSFQYSNNKKEKLRVEIQNQIDAVFQGQPYLKDGHSFDVKGDFEYVKDKPRDQSLDNLLRDFKFKDTQKKIYAKFTPDFIGGVFITTLVNNSKENRGEGYTLYTIEGREIEFYAPVDRNYVPIAYEGVLEYYRKNSAFTPDGNVDYRINNFKNINNEYFHIWGESDRKYDKNAKRIYSNGSTVYNDIWQVSMYLESEVFQITETYRIEEDLKKVLKYSCGGYLLLFLLCFLLLIPFFRKLGLYGKEWKNENNSQLLIFTHSFFKPNEFTEILDDQVTLGKLKIGNMGKQLSLVHNNNVEVFQIIKVSQKKLTLFSLKEKRNIIYSA
jgi:hypothetical protein